MLDLSWVYLSSPLAIKKENQDNLLLIDGCGEATYRLKEQSYRRNISDWPADHWRFAVMDGLGSLAHSRHATDMLVQLLINTPPQTTPEALGEALDDCHQQLRRYLEKRGLKGGCTLCVMDINPKGRAHTYHVGDSRLFALDAQHMQCLTIDHAPATYYACQNKLTEAQWRDEIFSRNQSRLLQAVGRGGRFDPGSTLQHELFALDSTNLPVFLSHLSDRRCIEITADHYYILATDGLWDVLEPDTFMQAWKHLAKTATSPEALLKALLKLLQDTSTSDQEFGTFGDNTTAIVFRWRGSGSPTITHHTP